MYKETYVSYIMMLFEVSYLLLLVKPLMYKLFIQIQKQMSKILTRFSHAFSLVAWLF